MSYHIGVFGYGPNPSAALLENGVLVAFVEEERYNRIKMAPNSLPVGALMYCLKEAGIGIDDVECIGFGWDCDRYVAEMPGFHSKYRADYPTSSNEYNVLQDEFMLNLYDPKRIRTDFQQSLALQGVILPPDKIRFLPHHLCHAASTYHASGFRSASILTIDGSGEEASTVLWHANGAKIKELERFDLPHTLGGYYATFTEFMGFRANQDEGKLMGLASYGAYSEELQEKLNKVLSFSPETGSFRVNPYMRYLGARTYGRRFTDELVELFGKPRLSHQAIEKAHRDLAFNVQWRLEKVVQALARDLIKRTGDTNLCLAGGVAMNCCMNGKLAMLPEVAKFFVQPASADNGIALGAAYLVAGEAAMKDSKPMVHAYWGNEYTDKEIEGALKESKLPYRRAENLVGEVASFLQAGKIIGWLQGRMEVGARALGGRSILASPVYPNMKDKLNLEVKHREDWRPFCPSLPIDDYSRYFDFGTFSDFMIMAFPVKESMRSFIPSVVHVDGTARPQTVRRECNQRFYDLLKEFGRLSGHPVLINTSFNIQGEPIVCTPRDALRCFGGTGIDILVMGDFIVEKVV